MNPFSLILLVLGVVEPILAADKIIPTPYQGLAAGILNAVNAVKTQLTGPNATLDVTAVSLTQAIASGLSALEVAGALPTTGGGLAVALASAAAAGTAAYEAAGQNIDPSQLKPIAPVA